MDIQALLMNKSGIRKRKAQIFISKKRKEKKDMASIQHFISEHIQQPLCSTKVKVVS